MGSWVSLSDSLKLYLVFSNPLIISFTDGSDGKTMRDTQVQSLGWEDLLEKEMATHSSILAWKIS